MPGLPAFGLAHVELADALEDADIAASVTAHPDVGHARVARALPSSLDFGGVTRHLRKAHART